MPLKKKIIFSCILFLFGLIILELTSLVVLSIFGGTQEIDKHIFHNLRHHAHEKNGVVRVSREEPNLLPTDEYGYTKVLPQIKKPDLTVVLTGSSSLRSQNPFTGIEGTIPSRLQNKLYKRFGNRVRVRSLATAGYTSFHEMMTLYEYTERYQLSADIVLSVNGIYVGNSMLTRFKKGKLHKIQDARAAKFYNDLTKGKASTIFTSISQYLLNSKLNTIQLLIRISKAMQEKNENVSNEDSYIYGKEHEEKREALYSALVKRERMNYKIMHEIAKANNSDFILVLLPAAYSWTNFPREEMNSEYKKREYYRSRFYQGIDQNSLDYSIANLENIFDDVPVDLSPYSKDDSGKFDLTHYNDKGAEIIAQNLYEKLIPLIEKKLNSN